MASHVTRAPTRLFADRADAGRELAGALMPLAREHPVVLALPRGGVPVGFEVAKALLAPLDVLPVRKVGAPGHPEYGIGAVAEGGVRVLDESAIEAMRLTATELDAVVARAASELAARIEVFRGAQPQVDIAGRPVIVVDDGLATGGTASAAVRAARARGASRVVLAVPVGAAEVVDRLQADADDVICLRMPSPMYAVGLWYRDFAQVPDEEVSRLLTQARRSERGAGLEEAIQRERETHAVDIPVGAGTAIKGDLAVPAGARGLVIFAHGSGSGRLSARNRHVAAVLEHFGLATMLIDLLSEDEERIRENVFDIPLLAGRLDAAAAWAAERPITGSLPIGYFGASTGGGAALLAAAGRSDAVRAVVSRGGRPDLAGDALAEVTVPVLLVVGGEDREVLALNRIARERLGGISELAVIPGATHLFEEPGTLDEVARLAADWFNHHLQPARLG